MEFFHKVIGEKEFTPIADKAARGVLTFASYISQNKNPSFFSKRSYVGIAKESMELEDFLDDHGARKNKTWVYFGEIVASIRNLSRASYIISHILSRLNFYRLNPEKTSAFREDANTYLDFFNNALVNLFNSIAREAKKLGLTLPSENLPVDLFEESIIHKILPQNINADEARDIHEHVTKIASECIDAYNDSLMIMFENKIPLDSLSSTIIPEKINEETLRHCEAHVHNTQSMYDTYIQKTPVEAQENILASLRGNISISLHLLGLARELSHFIERHETTVRVETTRKKISKIIDRNKIIDTIINFSLYYYTQFINDAKDCAQKLLNTFTVVESCTVKVPEGLGFHLRPSTLVAKIANHYGSSLTMIADGKEFDASSVIDIMWAGGMIKKNGIDEVTFKGDKNAIRDIAVLADANYGEDAVGNSSPLPEAVDYLRQQE